MDRRFSAYVFDLDGTLLDTLSDLVLLTNAVLEQYRVPTHSRAEILSYVGGGSRVLLQKAFPEGTPESTIDEAQEYWQNLYPEYGHKLTCPFEGIPQALSTLKGEGAKLAVLSNKFDAAAKEVIETYLPGLFDVVEGERPSVPRKPDPTGLLAILEQLNVAPARVAYVGDSGYDMEVANRVGAYAVGVTWGYRPVEELVEKGANVLIDDPSQLTEL